MSQHHAAYLAALPGKPSVRWQTLKRWHAAFDVEATPAVVPAVLPKDGPTQIATIDSLLARGVPSSLSASATAAVRHVHDVRAALNPEKASSEPGRNLPRCSWCCFSLGSKSSFLSIYTGRSATGAALPLPVPVPRAVPTETSTAVPDSLKGLLSGEAAARIVARQKQRTEAMLRVDSVDLSRASRLEGLMPLLNILWGATK